MRDEEIVCNICLLFPGCRIVAYTDGLLKGEYKTGEQLAERIKVLIEGGCNSEGIASTLIEESRTKQNGPWADDIGVICLRY